MRQYRDDGASPGFTAASAAQRFSPGFLAWLLCCPLPERGNQLQSQERGGWMLQTTELAPPVQGVRAAVSSGWARKLAITGCTLSHPAKEEHWQAGAQVERNDNFVLGVKKTTTYSNLKSCSWTSEVAQCVRVLAAKPEDPSLIPRTHCGKRGPIL